MIPPVFCDYPVPSWLLFSENVPPLVYYSHFIALLAALFVGFFVLISQPRRLPNRILFYTLAVFFSLWVFLDSVFWAARSSDVIMFVWSLQILVEPLVHLGGLYLFYVLVKQRDVSLKKKLLFLLPYLPIALTLPTGLVLPSFDITSCLSVEGFIAIYYTYPLELFYTSVLIVLAIRWFRYSVEPKKRREIFFLATGIIFFLLAFSWGNIVSSIEENWNFAQIGLFSVPIFVGFLAYSIVRFQTFNIKVAGSITLVGSLWFAELTLIFLQTDTISRVVTVFTFIFTTIIGVLLVRSVQHDAKRREEITRLAQSLEIANERLKELDRQKTEFLSIASHQLRTPLSIIKGYLELIDDGAYGAPSTQLKQVLSDMDQSNERLIALVDEFLDISRIEQGRTKFSFGEGNLCDIITDVVKELRDRAAKKQLTVTWNEMCEPHTIIMDSEKIRQVIFNYIDNAIKYSDVGAITVQLDEDGKGVTVRVVDQGIGFEKNDEGNFFQKFYRGNNVRGTNVNGTGLGIYVCRQFVEGHGGRVWAKSSGLHKGSEFGFWIPRVATQTQKQQVPAGVGVIVNQYGEDVHTKKV